MVEERQAGSHTEADYFILKHPICKNMSYSATIVRVLNYENFNVSRFFW